MTLSSSVQTEGTISPIMAFMRGCFLDVSKDFKEGRLSCYLNNSGDDRPKFKVSDKPLDGYRHFGRLVASMKNYEV